MSIQDSLTRIRPTLQKRASAALARGAGVRENFQDQLTRFFDLLEQALDSGDAAWLDPLLQDWSRTRTETDLEEGERNVTALLSQIVLLTQDAARETLDEPEALELVSALLPIYLHCIERVTTYENESRITYLSNELAKMNRIIERLDKSKSNFVAVAAHEFKTPLTLIEGYTAMIGDLLPPEMEQIQSLVHGVHNGLHRLRDLVNDMLDVSMIDNNMLALNMQPVWLHRMFKLMKAELLPILEQRRQNLEIHAFKGAEELIFADPGRLYQALKNIINNGIKFTPDGGAITVNGRLLPGFVEVTITDTGIGIALENQDVVFEKFGQLGDVSLHSSGKTKFKGGGAGMGLPIAKGIIEAHGGSLWVESSGYDEKACPGSTFHILLPLRTQPEDPGLAKLFGSVGARPDSTRS
jgi:signal transduction histidine kinase